MKKTLNVVLFILFSARVVAQAPHSFIVKDGSFWLDGETIQIRSGEMHFARVPQAYWRHRLKMIKAMGLNTVASYVFWNYHETAPGVWDFKSGNRNIVQFIKIAQEEGLMVILRPGPYACAEWEFGGYPWWLQKNKDLVIRTDNKPFLDSCRQYIQKLAEQVKGLQITHGGPIIMVQAENEFGSYVAQRKDIPLETHKKYATAIKDQLLAAGFDVPLFTSDGSWLFEGGSIKGILPTANGESNIKKLKAAVNQYHKNKGPYMVAEFYPGWLDHWGEPFVHTSVSSVLKQTEIYLKDSISFNFYMIHGGTNFAFTAGANYSKEHEIQPDITSYDYDAPISEAGWPTVKFDSLRLLIGKYTKHSLPSVPARINTITVPNIRLQMASDLYGLIKGMKPVEGDRPLTFEELNQGYGYVLYRKKFNQPISGKLILKGLRDYALIYIDGKKIGELDRNANRFELPIDVPFNSTLDIFVENMGRINYGANIVDNLKGIVGPVIIGEEEITGDWQMFRLPMTTAPVLTSPSAYRPGLPAVFSGMFNLQNTGDTFIDMRTWGKGIVFVNGHHLGRYWSKGPQQTLYLPGCWLKKGTNRIEVFEQQNDKKHTVINFLDKPILDDVHQD